MKGNLIVLKQQDEKELKKMIFKTIFLALVKKSEDLISQWRIAEGNQSPTIACDPKEGNKANNRDVDLFIKIVLQDFESNKISEEVQAKINTLVEIVTKLTDA